MKNTGFLFYLKSYMKDHRKVILFFVLSIIIFLVIIGLYNLPLEAVGYAAILCVALALLFMTYDMFFYIKRNRSLVHNFKIIANTIEEIPMPKGLTEENWEQLLTISYESGLENQNKINDKMTEMMEYYTMWVHQVKTPISAMKLLLQSDDGLSTELKRNLNNELAKIEQYVDMVLSYMRLESETTDYVIKEYDLDTIIKKSIKKFSTQFINKNISLNFEPTGLKAITDEKWLGYALEQILSNAIKYTDTGTVTIGKITDNQNPDEKILEIKDTGIGIAPEDIPRVFDKGYTGYNGRIEKKSSGIGLFLTKRILVKLGHRIEIESEPDEGTAVYLGLTEIKL